MAARDNAEWCGMVCASHGLTASDARSVPRRSPPWYPDAATRLTLTPLIMKLAARPADTQHNNLMINREGRGRGGGGGGNGVETRPVHRAVAHRSSCLPRRRSPGLALGDPRASGGARLWSAAHPIALGGRPG